MARKGRLDRGLMKKTDLTGRVLWCVRLWHNGKEKRFGSFKTKTEARDFYEKAKQEQREGRFFPEKYQRGGYDLVSDYVSTYMQTIRVKKLSTIRAEQHFSNWWCARLEGHRLNAITPVSIEEARQALLSKGLTQARVNRYVTWLRHVLYLAVRNGKLQSNPVTKLRMYKESKGKTRFLTPEEEAKLYDILGPV